MPCLSVLTAKAALPAAAAVELQNVMQYVAKAKLVAEGKAHKQLLALNAARLA